MRRHQQNEWRVAEKIRHRRSFFAFSRLAGFLFGQNFYHLQLFEKERLFCKDKKVYLINTIIRIIRTGQCLKF